MKYTEKDVNDDFDYLARKCGNFKNTLLALSLNEDEFKENIEHSMKYFLELADCFKSLETKYAPYFPELSENKFYVSCDKELENVFVLFRISGVEFEFNE